MRYRKKPVVIEAVCWDGNLFTGNKKPQWLFDAANDRKILASGDGVDAHTYRLKIFTLEGEMTAEIGDYIIQGVKGELYPCKPDIFAATYEAVKETASE